MFQGDMQGQNDVKRSFQSFKRLFEEITLQNKEMINILINQNQLIDHQLNYNPTQNFRNPRPLMYQTEDFFNQANYQNSNLKLDQYEEIKLLHDDSCVERQKEETPFFSRELPYKSVNSLLKRKIQEKSEQFKFNNEVKNIQNQFFKHQKPTSTYRRPQSGLLQDIPGNPLENRLITQFFEKQVPLFIDITGKKESTIYKKQLLACYIQWRLKQLPEQRKLKQVNIQVNISSHIRHNYNEKCKVLRHVYTGMEFKSLKTVKSIINLDLDKYKAFQKRGRSSSIKKIQLE